MARITVEDCLQEDPEPLPSSPWRRPIVPAGSPVGGTPQIDVDPLDRDKPTVIALREIEAARSASRCSTAARPENRPGVA